MDAQTKVDTSFSLSDLKKLIVERLGTPWWISELSAMEDEVIGRTILLVVHYPAHQVNDFVIYRAFSEIGVIEDVRNLPAESGFHSRVRFRNKSDVDWVYRYYNGAFLPEGCCKLEIHRANDVISWDTQRVAGLKAVCGVNDTLVLTNDEPDVPNKPPNSVAVNSEMVAPKVFEEMPHSTNINKIDALLSDNGELNVEKEISCLGARQVFTEMSATQTCHEQEPSVEISKELGVTKQGKLNLKVPTVTVTLEQHNLKVDKFDAHVEFDEHIEDALLMSSDGDQDDLKVLVVDDLKDMVPCFDPGGGGATAIAYDASTLELVPSRIHDLLRTDVEWYHMKNLFGAAIPGFMMNQYEVSGFGHAIQQKWGLDNTGLLVDFSKEMLIFDPGGTWLRSLVDGIHFKVIKEGSNEGQDDLKISEVNNMKAVLPLLLDKSDYVNMFKLLNAFTVQEKMISKHARTVCFDPGGEYLMPVDMLSNCVTSKCSGLASCMTECLVVEDSYSGAYVDFIEVNAPLEAYKSGIDSPLAEISLLRLNPLFETRESRVSEDSAHECEGFMFSDHADFLSHEVCYVYLVSAPLLFMSRTFAPLSSLLVSGGYHNSLASLLYQVELYKLLSFLRILQSATTEGMQLLVSFTMMALVVPKIYFTAPSLGNCLYDFENSKLFPTLRKFDKKFSFGFDCGRSICGGYFNDTIENGHLFDMEREKMNLLNLYRKCADFILLAGKKNSCLYMGYYGERGKRGWYIGT